MAFAVHRFIASLAKTLEKAGFIRTAADILNEIRRGRYVPPEDAEDASDRTRRAYSLLEQQKICADIIEQNIILRYAMWEASALELGRGELFPPFFDDGLSLERRLLVVEDEVVRPLGSFGYRDPMEKLQDIANRLRGMDPTPPSGNPSPIAGGGSSEQPLQKKTRRTGPDSFGSTSQDVVRKTPQSPIERRSMLPSPIVRESTSITTSGSFDRKDLLGFPRWDWLYPFRPFARVVPASMTVPSEVKRNDT